MGIRTNCTRKVFFNSYIRKQLKGRNKRKEKKARQKVVEK